MYKKKIAVLMSTYNGEKYLKCQIDSILNQKLENVELYLIIRDDGSKDKTLEIINVYSQNHNNIIFLTGDSDNKGYIESFMKLIIFAKKSLDKYDYISLADQDDRWDSNKLQKAINMIESEDDVPILYQSRSRTADEQLNYIGLPSKPRRPLSLYNTMIQIVSAGHTYVFNRKLLELVNDDIDCSKLYGHDAYLTNLANIFGIVIFDCNAYADYRQHNSNQLGSSNNGKIVWIKSRLQRIKAGHAHRYGAQIAYLTQKYGKQMEPDEKEEFERFLDSQKHFMTRLIYILKTKLYRQGKTENLAFRMLYLLGGYKPR